jgi:leader peptidase (prepilin peptidase)/N-methyltransferase
LINPPEMIWMLFFFAIGASAGSFLNVVVYRVPAGISIVRPPSHCTKCKHRLAWYDNLPIFGWLILGGKCRYCKVKFSFRYPLVELVTALLFVSLYWAYFIQGCRAGLPAFDQGGWIIFIGHLFLLGVLLSSSLIDAELWIIPLSVSYSAAVVGVLFSMIAPYYLDIATEDLWRITPYVGVKSAATALGACLGLGLAFLMVKFGLIQRSFEEFERACQLAEKKGQEPPGPDQIKIRREMVREIAFLSPLAIVAFVTVIFLTGSGPGAELWGELLKSQKWLAGLLGSLFGFMIGGGVVWAVRILGSLAFGREAMGLGDVHLMAAIGAVLGWTSPTVAFFVAPFFGLGYALVKLFLHRSREIPYGPFLSLATLLVMVLHDPIMDYLIQALTPATMP